MRTQHERFATPDSAGLLDARNELLEVVPPHGGSLSTSRKNQQVIRQGSGMPEERPYRPAHSVAKRAVLRREPRHPHRAFGSEVLAVHFDAFDLMKCARRKVTFPTVWARYEGNIFDDQEIPVPTKGFGDPTEACASFPADIADHLSHLPHNM